MRYAGRPHLPCVCDTRGSGKVVAVHARPARRPGASSAGIGKPEPLKGDLSGYWSRRIDDEHRLVYRATEKEVVIIKARYHY